MDNNNMFTLDNPEWKAFLTHFYGTLREKNPSITLEQIYPIAQRKFLMNQKNTGLHLNLMANPKKIKKN